MMGVLGTSVSAYGKNPPSVESECERLTGTKTLEDFLSDPRFHWAPGEKGLERKLPNIFGSVAFAFTYDPVNDLTDNLPPQEKAFFDGVFHTLRDLERVHFLIHQLLSDLDQLVEAKRSQGSLPFPESELRPRAYASLLTIFEKQMGIGLVTIEDAISGKEMDAIMADGNTFIDDAGSHIGLHLSDDVEVPQEIWPHGQWTHRMQLHLIIRDSLLRPEFYGAPESFLEMYKAMGQPEFNKPHNLFFHLFDSPENNGSSPGFYQHYREYWPGLPLM